MAAQRAADELTELAEADVDAPFPGVDIGAAGLAGGGWTQLSVR